MCFALNLTLIIAQCYVIKVIMPIHITHKYTYPPKCVYDHILWEGAYKIMVLEPKSAKTLVMHSTPNIKFQV